MRLILLCISLIWGAGMVCAQNERAIEAGLSTLGLYAAPGAQVGRNLHVRAPLYFGGFSERFRYEGNDIDTDIDVTSLAVMLDYYVGGSGLRLSGGVSFGDYRLAGQVTTLTLDGVTYNTPFALEVAQERDIAPVIALGYQRDLGANWGISAELGARFSSAQVSTQGQDALPAGERTTFDQSIRDINDDLDEIGVIPYVALGLSFQF